MRTRGRRKKISVRADVVFGLTNARTGLDRAKKATERSVSPDAPALRTIIESAIDKVDEANGLLEMLIDDRRF